VSANDQFSGSPEWVRPDDEFVPSVVPAGELTDVPPVLPADYDEVPLVQRVPRPPHPGFWWSVFYTLVILIGVNVAAGVLFVVMLVARAVLTGNPREFFAQFRAIPRDDPSRLFDLIAAPFAPALILSMILSAAIACVVIRFTAGRDWMRRIALRPPSPVHLLLVLVGFPAAWLLAGQVNDFARELLNRVHVPNLNDQGVLLQIIQRWPLWVGVLAIGLGPAVAEELWCRAFMGRGLVGRFGPIGGIALTSLFFGLMHVDPGLIIATGLLGVWLHYVYLTTRSLWLPMLTHFLNNSLAVVLTHYPALQKPVEHLNESASAGAFALLVAVAWALYVSRARLLGPQTSGSSAWQPDHPGVEHPPPATGTTIHRPWPGWVPSGLVAASLSAFLALFYLAQPPQ